MDTIGLQAVFQDADFQAGLARYTAGLARAESATGRTANAMTAFGHTISTAIGTAIGYLAAQALPALERAIMSPINATRAWGEQLDLLRDEFGMSGAEASKWAVSMSTYMGGVDEGASGLSAFVRNLNNMQDGLKTAGAQYSSAMQDIAGAHADAMNRIARDWAQAQADAGESIASIWQDLADRRTEIEQSLAENVATIHENLADQIASIQDSLNERLADFARERAEIDKDTTKSLARLEDDTKDRLRNAHSARERRQIRKDAAERKRDLLEQAAERKAEIDRQEAQAKEQAAKQMAQAEKVANKQIEAAERAAQKQIEAAEKAAAKQTEAIEKALAKQQRAMQEASEAEEKQFAKQQKSAVAAVGKSGESDPIAKALKQLGVNAFNAQGKVRPFAELMPEIMDAFKALPPGINASAIAMQLFGKSGSKFLDFLRQGREGLVKAREEAIAWGLVMSDEEANAIEEMGFELNRLNLQFTGLAVTIGREMIPYVRDLVSFIRTDVLPAFLAWTKEHMPAIKAALKDFGDWLRTDGLPALREFAGWVKDNVLPALQQFADWMKANWPAIQATIETFWKIVKPLLQAFGAWLTSDGIQALGTFFDKVAEFEPLVKEWKGWMDDMLGTAKSTTKGINDDAGLKFPKLADIVRDSMDTLKRYFQERMEFIRDFQKTTTALMEGNWRDFFGNLVKLFTDVWNVTLPGIVTNALTNIGKTIGRSLIEPINAVIEQINQIIEKLGGIKFPKLKNPNEPLGVAGGSQDQATTYDLGGWVSRTGPALVHAGEYVLNPMQARVMAPVLTSPNYSRTYYNFNHNWTGSAGGMDRREIERIVETATMRSIRQVVGAG